MRRLARGAAPVSLAEVIPFSTAPFTMAPGVPLRGARCLVCSEPIGAEPVTIHLFFVFDQPACGCGNAATPGFLRHASCPAPSLDVLLAVATERVIAHHPEGK
jgi:hypothetical protein